MESHDYDFQTSIPLRLPFRAFLPDDYDGDGDGSAYPLIMFLHGSGQRGDDLAQMAEDGIPARLTRGPALPFVVVAPQCPRNLDWSTMLPGLDALLLHVLRTFRVDPDRIYLTGLSMGGYGVWAFASGYPQHFAAVAPVCGGGAEALDFPERLKNMTHLPVWCFHGDQDDVVPVEETRRLARSLEAYGGNVKCTIYPGVGHDSWTQAYEDPELCDWFLRHVRHRT